MLLAHLVLSTELYGQEKKEFITISGQIFDQQTQSTLPYASVVLRGTAIGTVSNEEGRFELTLDAKYQKGKIRVSFIGYENAYFAVDAFKKPKKIALVAATTPLEQIVVTTKNKYRQLVVQSIENMKKNYSQVAVKLEAYYRELTQVNDRYTRYTDAACSILYSAYDGHFDTRKSILNYKQYDRSQHQILSLPYPEPEDMIADEKDKVHILALRKSDNLQRYKIITQADKLKQIDTTDLKWLENNEIGGGPLRLTGADKLKRGLDFLDAKNLHEYRFSLYGKSSFNNKPVYIIGFKPKNPSSLQAKYQGRLTIDEISKAVVGLRYRPTLEATKRNMPKFGVQLKIPQSLEKKYKRAFLGRTISLVDFAVDVSYFELNNRWYLKRIRAENTYKNSGDLFKDFTCTTQTELVITNLSDSTTPTDVEHHAFPSFFTQGLFNFRLPYDPNFWKRYSNILPSSSNVVGQALKDLQSQKSLERQFEKH